MASDHSGIVQQIEQVIAEARAKAESFDRLGYFKAVADSIRKWADTLSAVLVSLQAPERELLPYARLLELCDQFGITETDALKHALEDWQRFEADHRAALSLGLVNATPEMSAIKELRCRIENCRERQDDYGRGLCSAYQAALDLLLPDPPEIAALKEYVGAHSSTEAVGNPDPEHGASTSDDAGSNPAARTSLDITAIKARLSATTPGEWRAENVEVRDDGSEGCAWGVVSGGVSIIEHDFVGPRNAEFIAHAHQDIPALIAEVEYWRSLVSLGNPHEKTESENVSRMRQGVHAEDSTSALRPREMQEAPDALSESCRPVGPIVADGSSAAPAAVNATPAEKPTAPTEYGWPNRKPPDMDKLVADWLRANDKGDGRGVYWSDFPLGVVRSLLERIEKLSMDSALRQLRHQLADPDCTGWTCPNCGRAVNYKPDTECDECGFDITPHVDAAPAASVPASPEPETETREQELARHKAEWDADCMKWRGRILTGEHTHWCFSWDGLPMDETCPEFPCECFQHLRAASSSAEREKEP